MWQKVYLILVILFFLTMNALLWRSEFYDQDLAVPVPVESVVRRVLDAADDSSLEIRHHGRKVGFCRWSISLIEAQPDPETDGFSNLRPEGMVPDILGHNVDFDGSFTLDPENRLRFNFSLVVNTNQQWDSMNLRLTLRPVKWEMRSQASDEMVQFIFSNEDKVIEHKYPFAELSNPLRIIRDFGRPLGFDPMGAFGWTLPAIPAATSGPILRWEARTDRHQVGNSLVPVYRVEAPLLDKFRITIYIQKSGEILRISLPDNIELVNDKLTNL